VNCVTTAQAFRYFKQLCFKIYTRLIFNFVGLSEIFCRIENITGALKINYALTKTKKKYYYSKREEIIISLPQGPDYKSACDPNSELVVAYNSIPLNKSYLQQFHFKPY